MTDTPQSPRPASTWTAPEEVAARMVRPAAAVPGTWRRSYARWLAVADAAVLVVVAVVATWVSHDRRTYAVIGVLVLAGWLLALRFLDGYDRRMLGEGSDEYRRLLQAVLLTFAVLTVISTLVTFQPSRLYLAVLFLGGGLGMCAARAVARRGLRSRRRHGEGLNRVLIIGGARSARRLAAAFEQHPGDGYRVVGVWWPDRYAHYGPLIDVLGEQLPSYGFHDYLDGVMVGTRADTVIVTDTELLGQEGLNALGWALQGSGVDLLVSPNVVDFTGPRIHLRPVANLPLIHLDEPQFEGASRVSKLILDKTLALTGLVLASPVMIAIAIAVKATSPGPVLYRSQRIGVGGKPFTMLKFRTMVTGADRMVGELSADTGSGPLFKMREDPRVTRVGRFLRRYSLDELPQMINVLRGDMSVVGPRPPLQSEVDSYESGVERRLLVKQGMTGLWQVSGRSDLPWDAAVRLDLDYVENWSLVRDLQIIWRTIRAVVGSSGAY